MNIKDFTDIINKEFYTGVPDSTLRALTDYLYAQNGISQKHIVAANEGNAVAIAAGYYLSTGKIPVVYLQNSGIGNIINPVCSLLNEKIYKIPCIFIVGWRGEPKMPDEPQHKFQGEITLDLLKLIGINYIVVDKNTTTEDFKDAVNKEFEQLKAGKSIAIVVKRDALENPHKVTYKNNNSMLREAVIDEITREFKDAIIISTTGKASRELFEIRERRNEPHDADFLTVGSMGHCSSIAMEIALQNPTRQVICIDGDGALLMHMGAIGVIGANAPNNLVHIMINNESHESVGGLPTIASKIDFPTAAKACGYEYSNVVSTMESLKNELKAIKSSNQLSFLEIKTQIGSKKDLGRPTISPIENKINFMNNLSKGKGVDACKK